MKKEDYLNFKYNRFVSQSTGLICAHCGYINLINNRNELKAITVENTALEETHAIEINFTCYQCKTSYELGFITTSQTTS